MKKTALFILAAAVVAMGFTGCKKKSVSNEIVLTVWESADGPDEFIRRAGEEYSRIKPGVKINFVNVELGDAAGQVALDGPGGIGPDLFAAPHDKLGELVNGGHVLETVDPEEVKKTALASCVKALTYEGKMYGYPVSAETYALFYNKDLISESDVPKSWDDVVNFAYNFNANHPGKRAFLYDAGNAYYSIIWTTKFGNRLFGPTGSDKTKPNMNTDKAVDGMRFFQSLREICPIPSADINTAMVDGNFQSGNTALTITGLWNVNNFEEAGLNFGVAPLPSLPGERNPAASFSGTRAMFVSAYSEYPEEAAEFAEFLMTPGMQQIRFNCTGAMPAVDTDVSSKYMAGFLKQLEYAFPMPSIPEMSSFWDSMNAACKNIWDGADVQKELDTVNKVLLTK